MSLDLGFCCERKMKYSIVLSRIIFFLKLLADCYSLEIELWQEIILLLCSFLGGNCLGQYIVFCMMQKRAWK